MSSSRSALVRLGLEVAGSSAIYDFYALRFFCILFRKFLYAHFSEELRPDRSECGPTQSATARYAWSNPVTSTLVFPSKFPTMRLDGRLQLLLRPHHLERRCSVRWGFQVEYGVAA